MDKYITRSTTEVITENKKLVNDKFNSLFVKNIGTDNVRIFDNILLKPNEYFWWKNEPNVIITDDIQIAFSGNDLDKQLSLMRIYTVEV